MKLKMENKKDAKISIQTRMTDKQKKRLEQMAKDARYIDRASYPFKLLLMCLAVFLTSLISNEVVEAQAKIELGEYITYTTTCDCKVNMDLYYKDQICIALDVYSTGCEVWGCNDTWSRMWDYSRPEQQCVCRTKPTFIDKGLYGYRSPTAAYAESLILERLEEWLIQMENRIDQLLEKISIFDEMESARNEKQYQDARSSAISETTEATKIDLEKITDSKTESNSVETEISSNVARRDIPVVIMPIPCQDKYGEILHGVTCMAP